MSGPAPVELDGALAALERALAGEDVAAAGAALPAVLEACAALGSSRADARAIARAGERVAAALASAEQLRERIGGKMHAVGTSRKAGARYGGARRAF